MAEIQRLVIIGLSHKKTHLLCRCICGIEKEINKYHMASGVSRSCGCLRREATIRRNTSHGFAKRKDKKERLYTIWASMLTRCTNKKSHGFKWYGARGIEVCHEWKNFLTFRIWALRNGYESYLQIDRRNNDGNYSPNNCRWVTPSENCKNRRKRKR